MCIFPIGEKGREDEEKGRKEGKREDGGRERSDIKRGRERKR